MNRGLQEAGKVVLGGLADEVPFVGEVRSVVEEDYVGAALGVIPGGKYLQKALKRLFRKSKRKITNPYGKKGGPEHQATIDESEFQLQKEGFETQREFMVRTPEGEKGKRFVDVVGKDPATGEVTKMVQVGKQTKKGKPIAREQRAIDDIKKATGKEPSFRPYNKK